MENNIIVKAEEQQKDFRLNLALHSYKLAAGLLWQDRYLLLFFPLLLGAPGFLRVLVSQNNQFLAALASLVGEGIRLGLLFALVGRILLKHPIHSLSYRLRTLFCYGAFLWVITNLPFVTRHTNGTTLLLLSFSSFLFGLITFFFFIPVMLGVKNLNDVIRQSLKFLAFDLLMPVRALLAPFAFIILISALVSDPFPSYQTILMSEILHALGSTLGVYCAVGFGVSYWVRKKDYVLDSLGVEHIEHEGNTDSEAECLSVLPSKESLDSIENLAPNWLPDCLNLNSGVALALLALLTWSSNMVQLYSLPDSTQVRVTDTILRDKSITVKVTIQDPLHQFKRFHPMLFALASDKRSYLAQYPTRIMINGEELQPEQSIQNFVDHGSKDSEVHISVKFSVEKTKQQLERIQDLHLWYAADSVAPIVSVSREAEALVPQQEVPMQFALQQLYFSLFG
jgi:hypothetical protein